MRIAVVAHDAKKEAILKFVLRHKDFFSNHTLVATSHTARMLYDAGFNVERQTHGPQGGDVVIASMVVLGQIDMVFFFRDLLSSHAHEHDISTLLRMADLYNVRVAINEATAEALVRDADTVG